MAGGCLTADNTCETNRKPRAGRFANAKKKPAEAGLMVGYSALLQPHRLIDEQRTSEAGGIKKRIHALVNSIKPVL